MMQIELSAEEIHWLKYSMMMAIANLLDDDTEVRVVYKSVLEKLSDCPSSFVSENILEVLKPPRIYVLKLHN